ncbi:MAG: copper ion binding protein [Bacillota bacterium]
MSTTVSLQVEGITCHHCVSSIKKSVGSLEGVSNVGVDIKTKTVNVSYDPSKINVDTIKDAIEEYGYDVK